MECNESIFWSYISSFLCKRRSEDRQCIAIRIFENKQVYSTSIAISKYKDKKKKKQRENERRSDIKWKHAIKLNACVNRFMRNNMVF